MISIEDVRTRGQFVPTVDGKVFAFATGKKDAKTADGKDEPPVLLLHGFPTSSWDFMAAIEHLGARRRMIALDFLGFGLSDKPAEFGYSLFEQADATVAVAKALGITRAHVWAHDMGTSVATELLARRERGNLPFAIESLTLMNGSVHIEMAHLTLGQRALKSPLGPLFARLNTARTFKAQLRRVFARKPSDAELEAMWNLASRADGTLRFPQIIRYTEERARFRRRWIGALERFDRPALVAWGKMDPVAVLAIAEQLAREIPNAELVVWDDLGHYPQVEDPARVAAAVEAFWDRAMARGSSAASSVMPPPT